ncbi:MAG: hypothetical protein ACFE9T_02240 [Promethearchaeota archaeon]
MLYKSKLYISIIILSLGVGLLPTGFFVNDYIRDQVNENIPNVLFDIQEEAISEIETQYIGLGIAEILPKIMDHETKELKEDFVEVLFIPNTLLYLKDLSMPLFTERIKGLTTANNISNTLELVSTNNLTHIETSWAAQLINNTLNQVIVSNSTTSTVARDLFFNNYTFQADYLTSIEGISEFTTSSSNSLNYTATAQQRLLDGYLGAPGLLQDIENGTGVLGFMEFYANATIDPLIYLAIQATYNSTWEQLTALADYISNHLWSDRVPYYFNLVYGMTPSQYAPFRARELFFNDEDWSSTTNEITFINGISEYGTGGLNSLNFTAIARQRLLYGYQGSPGILEDLTYGSGVIEFLEYYVETSGNATMQSRYSATFYQLSNFSSYLTDYFFDIIIPAQLALEGLTLETAALRDFYTQWANGSIFSSGISLNELSNEMGEMLKATKAAYRIRIQINSVASVYNQTFAREQFFNLITFQTNYSTNIMGISEQSPFNGTYSRNFTITAQNRLLEGYQDYPGIFTEIEAGIGLLNWLDFYESARLDIGTNRTLIESVYNATWDTQISPFGLYIRDYILGTLITAEQKGLEVGIPSASNIIMNVVNNLWDPMNPDAIVNDTGILKWIDAANGNITIQDELNVTFSLTQGQFDKLYTWLIQKIKETLTPIVFIVTEPFGYRLLTSDYAKILLIEQWANGTVIPTGIELWGGIKGFEVGVPISSNISRETATNLLDTKNLSSFFNNNGILKWMYALNDSMVENDLMVLFKLEQNQMDMILYWLFTSFRQDVLLTIINGKYYYNDVQERYYDYDIYTFYLHLQDLIDLKQQVALTYEGLFQEVLVRKAIPITYDLARVEFFRQWSNGSLFINGLNPIGWELGIPTKSDINLDTSIWLWDEENYYSFVHSKGLSIWLKAATNKDTYNFLKDYYNRMINIHHNPNWRYGIPVDYVNIIHLHLDDTQMDAIIAWLLEIKEEFSHPDLMDKLDLPIDLYTYGEIWILGFAIASVVFLVLGCASLILVLLTKKR